MENTKTKTIKTNKIPENNRSKYGVTNTEVITVRPNTLNSENAVQLPIIAQRILFYSIYKIQHNQNTVSFTKQELNEAFGVDFGSYKDIKSHLKILRSFGIDIYNDDTEKLLFMNAFSYISYDKSVFEFAFNDKFLPALGEQKRFLQLGMQSIEKFKCRYTVYLYQFLKDQMWGEKKMISNIGLSEFKALFKIESTQYKGQNSNFRRRVWQPAVEEINEYTDYKISVITKGRGDAVRFTIVRTENEDLAKQQIQIKKVKNKQNFECALGLPRICSGCSDCMRINKCPLTLSDTAWGFVPESEQDTVVGLKMFFHYTLWCNEHYRLSLRIKNNVASDYEKRYYAEILEKTKQYTEFVPEENRKSLEEDIESERRVFEELYFGM